MSEGGAASSSRLPLQWRITLLVNVIILAFTVFQVAHYPAIQFKVAGEGLRAEGESVARLVAFEVAMLQRRGEDDEMGPLCELAVADPRVSWLRVVGPAGQLVLERGDFAVADVGDELVVASSLEDGRGDVVIGMSLAGARAAQDAQILWGALTGLAMVLGGIVFSLVASRAITRTVSEHTDAVASTSRELSEVSEQVSFSAEESADLAVEIFDTVQDVSANIEGMAGRVSAAASAIRSLAQSAQNGAAVAANAEEMTRTADGTIAKLGDTSQQIGNVLRLIGQISEQTKLLSLNARIEANRAGDAGRGFAVVANEIGELARATGRAAQQIRGEIELIQYDAARAVDGIGQIRDIVANSHRLQAALARSVDETATHLAQIDDELLETAKRAGGIAEQTGSVRVAAQRTTVNAGRTRASADGLAALAGEMSALVGTRR